MEDSPKYAPPQQTKEKERSNVNDCHDRKHRIQRRVYGSMEEVCTTK